MDNPKNMQNREDDEYLKQQRRQAAARRRAAQQREKGSRAVQGQQPQRREKGARAAQGQQPQQREKGSRAAQGQQPQQRSRRTTAQQPQGNARVQGQQPSQRRQQPRQRTSVSADAQRQQQNRRQAETRQMARDQKQAEHRKQMREQTMREHQTRMQQQRSQYGKGAYNASNYAGQSGATTRPPVVTGAVRTAVPGNLADGIEQASRRRRRRNIIIAVIAAIVLVLGGTTAAFAVSAVNAKNDAQELMTQGKNLVSQLKAGDTSGAQATAADFATTAKKLNDTTSSPLWAIATVIPVYGSDVDQVRTVAGAANMLADKVLVPVVGNMPQDGLKSVVVDGGINVQVLQKVLDPLGAASAGVHEYAVKLSEFEEPHIAQLQGPMTTIKEAFEGLDSVAAQASELSNVLPSMLGANGGRTYLLIACTEAEIRSTGGFPGSVGIMTVDNGKMHIEEFKSPTTLVPNLSDEEKLNVPAEEETIFGKRVSESFTDTTFIPHFPRAAELMCQMWEFRGNTPVDGFICVDPVFLQRLLALTGGVTASDGTVVDGTNAAEILMNGVYLMYPDNYDAQDALFAQVASYALGQIFGNLGSVDMVKFGKTLLSSLEDRRVYAWMKNASEQSVLENAGWACGVSKSETAPETGIYLGSAMGTKIFWYLKVKTDVSPARKNADGSMSYDVTLTLDNTLSEAAAASMPWYIVGSDVAKRSSSDMPMDIYLFAPVGGSITNMQTNGFFVGQDYYAGDWNTMPGDDPMTEASYSGYDVWYGMTQIAGETSTIISYTVTTSPKAQEQLALRLTPLPNESLQAA